MSRLSQEFLDGLAADFRRIVSDEKIREIFSNLERVNEVCRVLVTMKQFPVGSVKYKLLEDYGDNINKELKKPIDPRATKLLKDTVLTPKSQKLYHTALMGFCMMAGQSLVDAREAATNSST